MKNKIRPARGGGDMDAWPMIAACKVAQWRGLSDDEQHQAGLCWSVVSPFTDEPLIPVQLNSYPELECALWVAERPDREEIPLHLLTVKVFYPPKLEPCPDNCSAASVPADADAK